MKKTYRCSADFVVGKYLGEVEAESAAEAIDKARGKFDVDVRVCHFCARPLGDFVLDSMTAECGDESLTVRE